VRHAWLLVILTASRVAQAGPCEGVRVEGDGTVARQLARELARRGLGVAGDTCPLVRVDVESDGEALSLTIVDPDGRVVVRHAPDLAAAATLVESWATPSEADALLFRHPAAEDLGEPPAPIAPATSPVAMVMARPAHARGSLAILAETGYAHDDSLWLGVAVGACTTLGPICMGVRTRLAADSFDAETTANRRDGRLDADLMADAELAIVKRRAIRVAPGAGLGLGWQTTIWHMGGDAGDMDAGGVRAELRIAVSFPITRDVRGDFVLAVDLSPLARSAATNQGGIYVPGEPDAFARIGLGLRFGD
jgi:hypothetical protein